MNPLFFRMIILALALLWGQASIANGSWEILNPLPQGETLRSVWGTSGSNVYAVGEGGTVLHYNGNHWTILSKGIDLPYLDIFGFSETETLVFSTKNISSPTLPSNNRNISSLIKFNGLILESENQIESEGLTDIWPSSSTNIFAIHRPTNWDFGELLHYDGKDWIEVNIDREGFLENVWGVNQSNIHVAITVRNELDGNRFSSRQILHYNGSNWSVFPLESETLYDISGGIAQ